MSSTTAVLIGAKRGAIGIRRQLLTDAVLPWAAMLTVLVLVLVPLVAVLITSFRPQNVLPLDLRPEFTLEYYPRVFANPSTYFLLWNTFKYSLSSIALALPIALFFAWLINRTDLPGRGWLYSLMFVPMVVPGFLVAIAWVQLAGPNAGALNVYLRDLFGLEGRGPLNIFSIWGMVFVTVISSVPSIWLLLLGLFRNMDPALEDAAATAGANPVNTLRRITLPLLRPGIVTVFILYMVFMVEFFEIPLILGLTAGYKVLSVQIYLDTTRADLEGLPVYGLAATYAIIALTVGVVLIAFYLYAVRRQERFAVVTGKGYRPAIVKLGKWKYPCLALFGLYLFLDVVLPFFIIGWTSFQPFYRAPSLQGLKTFTLENYQLLLSGRGITDMLVNTAIVSISSAFATMFLATLIAWLSVRRPSPLTRVINALTFLPLAIPAPVIGLALIVVYIRAPIPIYGTVWILIMGFTTRYLAYSTRLMHAAQLQIDKSLDEAAYVSGAGNLSSFLRINLRLLMPAFIDGWIWVFAHAIRDFTLPLYLASGTSAVIANKVFRHYTTGDYQIASTFMVLLFVIVVIIAIFTRRISTGGWGR
ncbi:MAG TPA: iron ABC transporter permease [Candidatus Binatia bacterium]|jgi:iron(III) transport system permease protein